MKTWFDVAQDGHVWVVRCQAVEYGRYLTQISAFNAAVAAARKIKEAGRSAHVRVTRDVAVRNGDFLRLL